jgi:N-acetylglucosamine-6-phosphate deacetylase
MITGSFTQFIEGLEAVKSISAEERKRLGILGVHLEGRWIDEEKKGIHNPRYMPGVMTKRECDTLCKYGREGILKMLTISPTKVALSQIRQLTAAGILISIGHSTASSSEVAAAIHAGAKCVTHLGDAMK